jgi:hypothetical protein
MATKLIPVCKSCRIKFKTEREFQNHDCVRALEDLPLDQLLAMYEASKSKTN